MESYSTPTLGDGQRSVVSIKTLLDAGAHFGHQTQRWNPRMLPYIYSERNGIHIINLDLTLKFWERARKYIVDVMAVGGNILFVGTKPAAREVVKEEAERCNSFSVTTRWLGGTLSNFQTIKNSIERMRKLEDFLVKADDPTSEIKLHKREKLAISRELGKLEESFGGIRQMRKPPELIFVVDIIKDEIAVAEARRLHIPVIGLVDTNADPTIVDFPIPCNDDAARSIKLFLSAVADATIEGKAAYRDRSPKDHDKSRSSEANISSKESSNGSAAHGTAQGAIAG